MRAELGRERAEGAALRPRAADGRGGDAHARGARRLRVGVHDVVAVDLRGRGRAARGLLRRAALVEDAVLLYLVAP